MTLSLVTYVVKQLSNNPQTQRNKNNEQVFGQKLIKEEPKGRIVSFTQSQENLQQFGTLMFLGI